MAAADTDMAVAPDTDMAVAVVDATRLKGMVLGYSLM
jgi:hypothetical protein